MKVLHTIKNYFFYCGIEKDEYNKLKKDAYVSNFVVWRILHIMMVIIFGFLFVSSLFSELLKTNSLYYLVGLVYSGITTFLFFILKKDSLIAQFLIYLSISVLFLFGCLITQNKPNNNATTFIVLLLVTPMFMIDKPFFMAIELSVASIVYVIWMYNVKNYDIWRIDLINIIVFTIIGIFLNIIANSIRIREFVLTRKINIQKDTDDMTGLKNKGSLTRDINNYLKYNLVNKGVLFMLDVDKFKSINDTYGHDVGDSVIIQIGDFLGSKFINNEVVGRFGGDEFIIFIKDIADKKIACNLAKDITNGITKTVTLPDKNKAVKASIGIALYNGDEKSYSELFKKADIALYEAKKNQKIRYCVYDNKKVEN